MTKKAFNIGETYLIFRDGSAARVMATCVGRTKRTIKLRVPIDKAIKMGWLSEWNYNHELEYSVVTLKLVDKANEECERGTFVERIHNAQIRYTANANC